MKNPRYANPQGGILLDYDEDGMPSLYVGSGDLYEQAKSGAFGPVAPYLPPPPPTNQELAAIIREKRNALIAKSDWTQLPDVPEQTRELWSQYRQALRDVPQQPAFPQSVTWPEEP